MILYSPVIKVKSRSVKEKDGYTNYEVHYVNDEGYHESVQLTKELFDTIKEGFYLVFQYVRYWDREKKRFNQFVVKVIPLSDYVLEINEKVAIYKADKEKTN